MVVAVTANAEIEARLYQILKKNELLDQKSVLLERLYNIDTQLAANTTDNSTAAHTNTTTSDNSTAAHTNTTTADNSTAGTNTTTADNSTAAHTNSSSSAGNHTTTNSSSNATAKPSEEDNLKALATASAAVAKATEALGKAKLN